MPNIIEFKNIKRGWYNQGSIRNDAEARNDAKAISCVPPIETERIDFSSAIIRFHNTCFNPEIVDFALGRIKNGQDFWRLFKLNDKSRYFDPLCVNYMVIIDKPPKGQIDEAFCQIFSLMSEEVYIRELSAWPSRTSVDELTKVYQLDFSLGATISQKIAKTLKSSGIKNAYDLARLSREELCDFPDMTTQDIFKIEKSLAARGLFLTTKEVPKKTMGKPIALEG
ncbi:MAG: hypothetical protein Q4F56_00765 [Candidatus Saccharibacteria bacterium]|nr:hypothetical protein [Candidatus Saccharibacteria bacterium]